MANENKKDFNAMLQNNEDMLKIQKISYGKTIGKFSGDRMDFAMLTEYAEIMKQVPCGDSKKTKK